MGFACKWTSAEVGWTAALGAAALLVDTVVVDDKLDGVSGCAG